MFRCLGGKLLKNKKNIKKFLRMVFKNNRVVIMMAFIIVLTISALDLVIPQVIKIILDDAIQLGNVELLIKLVIVFSVIKITVALSEIALQYIYSKMKKRITINLKLKLLKHLSKLSGNYYTNIKSGNILTILENDIFIVENFGIEMIFSLIVNVITAFSALVFLVNIRFDLLLIVLVIQIVIIFSQSKFTKKIALKTKEIRTDSGDVSNLVQEYVSNMMNIVISKSVLKFFRTYVKKEKGIVDKWIRLNTIISTNISIAMILSSLITISIYCYGGIKIIKGEMSIGELIAFQQYTSMLIMPCTSIIKSNTRIQQASVSIDRIFNALDEPVIIKQNNNGNRCKENFVGNIEFKNVEFSYDNEIKTIDNLTLEFKNGKTTALVGSSGCGKSTIARLIFRLWDIDKGSIKVDDVDLKDYNLVDIRKQISVITQDLLLFDDTIFNNLTLGNKNISKNDVEYICKKIDVYDFISNLENSFETIVGEKGVKLSGGQKQKISIARALLSNSKILIFDEATSALDNISQRDILKNINEFLKNKTTIIIAHRLSTIKNVDKIYVIKDGKSVEEGTHEELINTGKYYYSFLNEQEYECGIG
ncbi:ABC transporter ATP-binding protein [Clostridioides sp. ES-S-0190-01]|nr:ABC transporter ATP-binding protein [Clostridioides sp. ES-S-0049-02]MCC0708850.1 ABC transporter ATP-binding protein [Clostridioides sp. ES-S-0190-01]UDN58308.1 ABC transporter ATP-binding protein [Clostridioides sp. ES-S-0010-02]UDN62162.1 ABC transporter ATP-binding protein [Clostridioides sp. ES-W-0016-02]